LTLIEKDLKITREEQIVLLTIYARLLEVIFAVKHYHECVDSALALFSEYTIRILFSVSSLTFIY